MVTPTEFIIIMCRHHCFVHLGVTLVNVSREVFSALKCHRSLAVVIPVLEGMTQLLGCEGDSDRAASMSIKTLGSLVPVLWCRPGVFLQC